MAKKSASKKRKQIKKKALAAKNRLEPVKDQGKAKKPAKAQKQPQKATVDQETAQLDEVLSESPPRTAISQKNLAYALVAVVIVFGAIFGYLYMSTQEIKNGVDQASQDQLLQVHPSDENSLQPSAGQGGTNLQPVAPTDNSGATQQLQPQVPSTQSAPTTDQ